MSAPATTVRGASCTSHYNRMQ